VKKRMKTTKRILAIFMIAIILLSLCSCGQTEQKGEGITLTDQAGRTVVLEKKTERVVSCYYVTTYAMLSLGLKDNLVGIEKKAETRPIYQMVDATLLDLPVVGSLKEINVEKIASLNPDLVILPQKLTDSAEALEELGIKTIIVNPETDANLKEMLRLIGKACGVEETAERLIAFENEKLSGFEPTGEKATVLFCGNSSYLTAAPSGMYQNDLIGLAGGINAFGETKETYWTEISYETVLKLDPDYVIIPAGADYTADELLGDGALAGLRAVKEVKVFSVPSDFEEWDSPIPSGVLGVLWLRTVLHPSDYTKDSFRKDVTEFYETFYHFTPGEALLNDIG